MSLDEIKIKNEDIQSPQFYSSASSDEGIDDEKYLNHKISGEQSPKAITRVKFLPSEDKAILDLVSVYGTDWNLISESFGPSRTKRQLRERWQNYLNPECNPIYTEEEDNLLMSLVEQLGTKWSKIAEVIGKKSAISCRNRHRVLVKEKKKKMMNKCHKNERKLAVNYEDNVKNENNNDQKNESQMQSSPNANVVDKIFDDEKMNFNFDLFFLDSPVFHGNEPCFNSEDYIYDYNVFDEF